MLDLQGPGGLLGLVEAGLLAAERHRGAEGKDGEEQKHGTGVRVHARYY
jgi:hypothetical protein